MSGRRRLDWLGLTPEPERELPAAVAALRASSRHPPTKPTGPREPPGPARPLNPEPPAELVASERRRLERLILRGSRRGWLRYLAEVTTLVTAVADGADGPGQGDRPAALLAGEVVLDHHRMLIGLPGTGYATAAGDRAALERAVRTLRTNSPTGSSR